jgi:hypothetical protein
MSYAVKILAPAEVDAVEAALWYEAHSPGVGLKFLVEVNLSILRPALNPEIHSIRFSDVRRAPLSRFRFYGVYYLIQGAEVWIIAVHYARRHPRWLQERREQLD